MSDFVAGLPADSNATVGIGCAADSAGVWCWLAAALAQLERGGSSRLASLLHLAAAGVGAPQVVLD